MKPAWGLLRRYAGRSAAGAGAVIGIGIILWGLFGPGRQDLLPRVAIAVSATGAFSSYARPAMEGAQLALEEANRNRAGPGFQLDVYDDESDSERARAIARKIVETDALVVVGPATTAISLAAGPIYAEAGLVSIGTTATGDRVTDNSTTFRASFTTGDGGHAMANYLFHVLGGARAAVLFREDGYGLPVANGFRSSAERLGIKTDYHPFKTAEDIERIARLVSSNPERPAVILGTLDGDAAEIVKAIRRAGVTAPILGTGAIAGTFFSALFASEPEERNSPGFFTRNLYAAAPEIFDSANAETSAFAARFRARFQKEPDFYAVQGYEAMRLAVAAGRQAVASTVQSDAALRIRARRDGVRNYLLSLDSPGRGIAGLNGPLWFTSDRGRLQPLRMGRFQGIEFETAPVQLVLLRNPSVADIASKKVVELESGRFAGRQQVVYCGIYLNEIAGVNIAESTFTADFYLWMRFAQHSDVDDLADIRFPTMVRGNFDSARPAQQADLDDGTTYRLWQVRGDFKNDFNLRLYPFDRQTFVLRFFHPRADTTRVVYVQDQRRTNPVTSISTEATSARQSPVFPERFTGASPAAFRHLTQWELVRTTQRRDNLVTQSALGDPRLVGFEQLRELSGFNFSIDVQRSFLVNLIKTLLPLGLMTIMLYTTLHIPPRVAQAGITAIVTCALAGAVLLASINSQLGNVGYVIAVEYGFYAFFALCILCLISVFLIENARQASKTSLVFVIERTVRSIFLATVGLIAGAAAYLAYVNS